LRPIRAASQGSAKEKKKQTAEYMPKHSPADSTPSVYSAEFSSRAPKTFRATAGPK
jgi:hypothetical protein